MVFGIINLNINFVQILCLHLKRFRFQDTQRIKVHTHIKFPLISLDMSHYLSNDVHLLKEEEYLFDLMAVVVHEGNGYSRI